MDKEKYSFDEMRVFDEAESAPERVVNVSAMSLQLGGEASVHYRTASRLLYNFLQRRRFPHSHFFLSLSLSLEMVLRVFKKRVPLSHSRAFMAPVA